MKRRLYYLFDHVGACKSTVNELLLARVGIENMHVLAKEGKHLGDLPQASLMQRSDIKHSIIIGLFLGTLMGILAGIAFHAYLNLSAGSVMIVTTLVGAIFGAWASAMIGMTTPNGQLRHFENDIANGRLLLMLDIPKDRVKEIEALLDKRHPEASFNGVEPTVPPFP